MSGPKRLKLDPVLSDLESACANLGALANDAPKNEVEGYGAILQIKALNRQAIGDLRTKKAKTQEAKQLVDKLNLQLQNLHYEQMNLSRQLATLQSQKPAVSWSDLISLTPAEAAKISHQEIVERLAQELQLRRSLEKEEVERQLALSLLAKGKEQLTAKLSSTTQELDIVVERAERVRDTLFEPERVLLQQQWGAANSLPTPLYVLFTKVSSYLSAFASSAGETTISLGAAQTSASVDPAVYRKDPQAVMVTLNPAGPLKIALTFEYLVSLGVVTLATQIFSSGALGSENALRDLLYPLDPGTTCPNPLASLDHEGAAAGFSAAAAGGYPYRWVQDLCGLSFPSPAGGSVPHKHVGDILQAIRVRAQTLVSLKAQIDSLQKGLIPALPQTVSDELFPFPPKTRLLDWRGLTATEGFSHRFSCSFERSRLRVEAVISVPHNYPLSPSSFSLSFANQGSQDSTTVTASPSVDTSALKLAEQGGYFDNNVGAIASELNDFFEELLVEGVDPSLLLTLQIKKLMMNLDIYIETDKKDTLAAAALASRRVRGRDRVKPYKYQPVSGLGHRNQFY